VAAIQAASAVIDGEAVCCDGSGVAIFEQLHKDGNRARLRWFLGDKR
jgi:hypothetical protein